MMRSHLILVSRLLSRRRQCHRLIHLDRVHYKSPEDQKEEESGDVDRESEEKRILYDGHIPTSPVQKLCLAAGSSLMSLIDPWRHDMVAVSGETTGHMALQHMLHRMSQDKEGMEILTDRPSISTGTVNFDHLRRLPPSSFGYRYADFMDANEISPDTRDPVKFVDDVELAYVMKRYREVHDLVHCLLGMRTNMLGEVTVKWVEAIQTNLPMAWGGAVFGAVRLAPIQRRKYVQSYLPWALRCGHEAGFLYNVYFEKRWSQDFEDLRRELRIPDPPRE